MENQDAGANEGMAAELNGDVSKPAPQPSVDERLQKILDKALYADGRPEAQKLRNFLNGTWLGEPLHAALTDLPVRCRWKHPRLRRTPSGRGSNPGGRIPSRRSMPRRAGLSVRRVMARPARYRSGNS